MVKSYRQTVYTAYKELDTLSTGDFAPDWFRGHATSGLDFSGYESLTELVSFDPSIDNEIDSFLSGEDTFKDNQFEEFSIMESKANDMAIDPFLNLMFVELEKIDKECDRTLKEIRHRLDNWGRNNHH